MKPSREWKGLVPKYAVYPHSSAEANAECRRLHAVKIEYAQDEDGRLWRRVKREKIVFRGQRYTEMVRWHIADMYGWFPGQSPAVISGARQQNTRARPPKKNEVYLIGDKPIVFART